MTQREGERDDHTFGLGYRAMDVLLEKKELLTKNLKALTEKKERKSLEQIIIEEILPDRLALKKQKYTNISKTFGEITFNEDTVDH